MTTATLAATVRPTPLLLRPFALLKRKVFANPVLHIELRRWMRGRRPVMLVTSYLILLFIVGTVAMTSYATRGRYGNPGQLADLGKTLMASVQSLLFFAMIIVTPGLTAAAIPRERENQTLGFLRMTLLTPGEIILGKFLVALCFCAILLILTMPFLATAFLTGGTSPGELASSCSIFMLFAALVASLNLVIGVDLKKSAFAFIIAYVAGFMLFVSFSGIGFLSQSSPLTSLFRLSGNAPSELLLFSVLAVVLLTATGLLLSIARERLAGWHERAAYLRVALLGGLLLPQAAIAAAIYWFSTTSSGSAMPTAAAGQIAVGLTGYALVFIFFTIILLGLRRPHHEQFHTSFPLALLRAHFPAAFMRENVLGFPFFLILLLAFGMVIPVGWLAATGHTAELYIPLAAFVFGAVQIIFWCGCTLALAVALLPRHLVGLGTVLLLAILFLTTITGTILDPLRRTLPFMAFFDPGTLSPFSYLGVLFESAGGSRYGGGGELLFTTTVVVHCYLLASILPWSLLALGWYIRRKRGLTGNDDDM